MVAMSFPSPDKLAQNAAACTANATIMNDRHVLEPKYDGWRLLVHVHENGVTAWSRAGKSQTGKLPHLAAWLANVPAGTWFDGELVAFDDKGMPEWGKAQSCMGSSAGDVRGECVFMAFDLLAYGGLDIRPLPFEERRTALVAALPVGPHARVTPQLEATEEEHDRLVAEGYEGSIVKELCKPYASGKRGQGWWKLKADDLMDAVIIGFKPGESSFKGMVGAIEFGQYKDGVLTYRGRCSGMTMKVRQEMTANQADYIGQVISLAFMGIMPSGSPRHPQFKMMRPDKPAHDCDWTEA
jgi:bifunctional non-homologous end joining protein LigD